MVTETAKQPISAPVATVDPAIAAAAATERAESARIRESVDTYVRGIGSRQIELLRQVFPSMPGENQKGWEMMFKMANDLSAQLIGTPLIVVHGAVGDANFVIEMKGRSADQGPFTRRSSVHARLQRTDRGWIFSSLDVSTGG